MSSTTTLDEFKLRQRDTWAAGDYTTLSEHIRDVGTTLVDRVGVESGMTVLDVACGTGNAAIPAALAGAKVTGLDLVPELLENGRRLAAEAGVDVEWVEGDAETLPFETDSFDRVLSTFGHMFAPRHRATADEMIRVSRPGGTIGICCWTPEGVVGDLFRTAGAYMPPPPDFASPPILWGVEEHVREMLGRHAREVEFERHTTTIEWDSVEGFADYFLDRFPVFVVARAMLGERFIELRAEVIAIWERWNESTDGRFVLPQEYLLAIVRL